MCEEKQVWKDQKTHQMEERRECWNQGLWKKREMNGEIEDEVIVEEKELRERMKVVQSIKNTRFK